MDSDIASRYTYEVPVVQGKDSYTKAEIDAMMSVVNGNFTKVNNRIDAMIEDTNNIKTQINNLYADMDSLNKNLDKLHTLVENYRTSLLNSINGVQGNLDAEIAARKAADASESSARQSADNALNKRCDNIDGKIKDLQGALSNTQERVKSLEGRVSSLEGSTKNLEDRASALESGLDAETKARIAADKSITDELHSVRDNLTEKYKALKTSVDDIGGKVKNMSKDVKANTDNIASINELLKNSFVFNGKHNTGISLAYDATQKKMRAYYNGQEVPLGSQTNALSDEGFSIKAGVIRANTIIGEHNSAISFSAPFKNACYGVVVSQSYISSSRNLSVNNLTKNGFTLYAGTLEVTSDIYYIAYGK
jgi:peptidoglycan hydrolase CwlO-like protein